MGDTFSPWIIGLSSGLISGLIVYLIIYLYEYFLWYKTRKNLLMELNKVLNISLSSIRRFLGIKFRHVGTVKNQRSADEYLIKFFQEQIVKNFNNHKEKIEYPNKRDLTMFLNEIYQIESIISNLSLTLIAFKKIKPKLITMLYRIKLKLRDSISWYEILFPEISSREFDSDKKIGEFRKLSRDQIFNLSQDLIKYKKIVIKEIYTKSF